MRVRTVYSRSFSFQSTPPGWEATLRLYVQAVKPIFQSTPPGWEATDLVEVPLYDRRISIHASRVGGDPPPPAGMGFVVVFQSTPPGWEATVRSPRHWRDDRISIHASRVGGDAVLKLAAKYGRCISIHASRVGGDF